MKQYGREKRRETRNAKAAARGAQGTEISFERSSDKYSRSTYKASIKKDQSANKRPRLNIKAPVVSS